MTGDAQDPSLRHFAATMLRKKLRAISKEIAGVRAGEDIEHVHRMRVASRRLRNALYIFEDCFPPKPFSARRRATRRITCALGEARDCDVQILFLKELTAGVHEPAVSPGIARMLLRLKQRRAKLQGKVFRALDRFEERDTVGDLERALRDLDPGDIEPRSGTLYSLAAHRVSERTDALMKYASFVPRAECIAEHHAMRIAAKRLRYTMEVFAPLCEDELRMSLQAVRDLQERLGQLHDCDVWVNFVPEFMKAERARTLDYAGHLEGFDELVPGMQFVREDRANHRTELHTQLVSFWNSIEERLTWPALQDVIEAHDKSYRARI